MRARQAVEVLSRAVHHHRRSVVCVGVSAQVAAVVWALRSPAEEVGRPYGTLLVGTVLVLVVSLVIANVLNRRRPRAFDLDGTGFATPRLGSDLLMGLSFCGFVAWGAALALGEIVAGHNRWQWGLGLLAAPVLCGLTARLMWVGIGVRLSKDGVAADRSLGSVFVPWEAFDRMHPPLVEAGGFSMRLWVARPELIRGRGWTPSPHVVSFNGSDPDLVADAVQFYVTHPERRAGLGTAEEYERLLAELPGAAETLRWYIRPPTGSDLTWLGFGIRVLVLAATLAVSLIDTLPSWLQGTGALVAAVVFGNLGSHAAEWARKVLADWRLGRRPSSGS